MAKITGLSDADRVLIQKLLTKVNKWPTSPSNQRPNPVDPDTHDQASDCYVARTPSTGIRGLASARPGYATCRIYQIIPSSTTPILSEVQSDRTVYNVATVAVPGSTWIVTVKDKFGKWLAIGSGGGAPLPGTVIDPTPRRGTGTGTHLAPGVKVGTGTHPESTWFGTGSPGSVTPSTSAVEVVTSVACVDGNIVTTTAYLQFVDGLFVGVSTNVKPDIPLILPTPF